RQPAGRRRRIRHRGAAAAAPAGRPAGPVTLPAARGCRRHPPDRHSTRARLHHRRHRGPPAVHRPGDAARAGAGRRAGRRTRAGGRGGRARRRTAGGGADGLSEHTTYAAPFRPTIVLPRRVPGPLRSVLKRVLLALGILVLSAVIVYLGRDGYRDSSGKPVGWL